jgi:hypothetical protein
VTETTLIPPYPNPYNAGFGVDPPYLAGRQAILHHLLANLNDGPGRATYISLIVGGRGVGKTVLLNQIRDHVTGEYGWPTIRWTAGPDSSLPDAINDAYDTTLDALKGRTRGRVGSVGINAGIIRADIDVAHRHRRPTTVAGQLRHVGLVAQSVNQHVVLLVDELQAGNPTSLRALSTTLQETNGEHLPVGLIAAGLPTTAARLRAVGGVTFLERQRSIHLANLEPGDAHDALERPLLATGRGYDPAILPILVQAAGGYPYAIQLVGEKTWDAAAAADAPVITVEHALCGAAVARAELDSIYEGRWAQLSPGQQDYLRAVVEQLNPRGSATSGIVAAALGRSTPQAAKQRDALINRHQLIYADGQNSLRIALPGLADWIRTNQHPPRQQPNRKADAPGSRTPSSA